MTEKNALDRVFIFEFAGMPKSGKTAIADIIFHYLRRNGYRTKPFHGGGREAPIDKAHARFLNLWIINRIVDQIITAIAAENAFPHVLVMDRGLFDRCAFSRALVDRGELSSTEYQAIIEYLTLPPLIAAVDAVFVFTTSPELSLQREWSNKLVQASGRVMNTDYLNRLRLGYSAAAQEHASRFKRILVIDTERLDGDVLGTASQVANEIEHILKS